MANPDFSALQQQIDSSPEIQAALKIFQQHNGNPLYLAADIARIDQAAKQAGVNMQLPKGYGIDINGKIKQQSFMTRHEKALSAISMLPAGIGLAEGLAAGDLLGPAASTTPSVAAGGGGAAASGAGAAGSGAAAGGGGAAAGAGGGSLLHALLPTIIGAGASVGGAAIASHGQSEAAKLQAAQDDKALALQKEMFDLQRSDTAPYRALGVGAIGNLAYLGGINLPPPDAANPAPSTVVAPGAVDANGKPMAGAGQNQTVPPPPTMAQQTIGAMPLSQLGQPNQGLVSMRNPQTGLVHLIPPDQVAAAQQAGGVRV